MSYKSRKKSFNRKYARAYSSFIRNPSSSSRARFGYYAKSHLSRYGNRSIFS